MSDEQTYIKFAIADFTRVMECAAACKIMFGTQICDAVVSALKKEVAVPARKEWDESIGGEDYYRSVCPECENALRLRSKFKYCPYCGQKIE